MDDANAERKDDQETYNVDFQISTAGKKKRKSYRRGGDDPEEVKFDETFAAARAFREVPSGWRAKSTQFDIKGDSLKVIEKLYGMSFQMDKMVKISKNKWSLTFIGEMQPEETLELPKAENEESNEQSEQSRLCAPSAVIQVELHEVEKG